MRDRIEKKLISPDKNEIQKSINEAARLGKIDILKKNLILVSGVEKTEILNEALLVAINADIIEARRLTKARLQRFLGGRKLNASDEVNQRINKFTSMSSEDINAALAVNGEIIKFKIFHK